MHGKGLFCSLPRKCVLQSDDWLRHYPRPFAEAIVRIRNELIAKGTYHHYPDNLPFGVSTFRSTPLDEDQEGLFKKARLEQVVAYLRSGSNLNLPDHWRDLIPHPVGAFGVK